MFCRMMWVSAIHFHCESLGYLNWRLLKTLILYPTFIRNKLTFCPVSFWEEKLFLAVETVQDFSEVCFHWKRVYSCFSEFVQNSFLVQFSPGTVCCPEIMPSLADWQTVNMMFKLVGITLHKPLSSWTFPSVHLLPSQPHICWNSTFSLGHLPFHLSSLCPGVALVKRKVKRS